ncbi:RTC4-like domain-containing protein [Coniochaeta sp. 2T2.1]|nr:RTC4-like domain-containing protein [Coniochaeta sp. 2T2.1]
MPPYGDYIPRRSGLSKSASVAPLLSAFKKQPETGRPLKIKEPDHIFAPPVSDSSDDDEATSRRGDIRQSTFETKSGTGGGRAPAVGTRKSTRTASTKPRSPKRSRPSTDEDEIDEPVKPAKKTRLGARKDNGLGSHFEGIPSLRKAAGAKVNSGTQKKTKCYGKAAKAGPKQLSSDPFVPQSPEKPEPARYKPVDLSDALLASPEKEQPKFVLPDLTGLEPTPSPPPVKFQLPYNPDGTLPDPSPSPSPSPEKPKAKTKPSSGEADVFMRIARAERQKKKAEKEAKRQQEEMEKQSTKVVFELPEGLTQDDFVDDAGYDLHDSPKPNDTKPIRDILAGHEEPKCPMCGEAVSQQMLDNFSNQKMMSINKQMRFCDHHKAKTARNAWVDKGYPDIDWSKLDARIAKHHKFLEAIVNGGTSHFGTHFARSIKSGKNKTLLKTDQDLTPGYYGTKGSRAMEDHLINHFADLLRTAAVKDKLVAARGQMAFVQFVLVPELAIRLIMEDMDVSAQKARRIMEESQKIGNLLNEEEDDVIEQEEEEDEEEVRSRARSTSSLSSLEDSDNDDPFASL